MDISSGIAAVTQGISIAKALRGIEKSYDEATLKAKIAEVIESLTDAKLALAEAKEGMAERDKEIERLRAAFEDNANLTKGPGDYDYKTDDAGRPIGYPICPKCHQTDGRIVQLKQNVQHLTGQCPVCGSFYNPVTAILHYNGGSAYTKQNEYDDKVAEQRRRQAEGWERLNRGSWISR